MERDQSEHSWGSGEYPSEAQTRDYPVYNGAERQAVIEESIN